MTNGLVLALLVVVGPPAMAAAMTAGVNAWLAIIDEADAALRQLLRARR